MGKLSPNSKLQQANALNVPLCGFSRHCKLRGSCKTPNLEIITKPINLYNEVVLHVTETSVCVIKWKLSIRNHIVRFLTLQYRTVTCVLFFHVS